MKKAILFLFTILTANLSNGQDKQVKGALGMNFGITKDQVLQHMREKYPTAVIESQGEKFISYKKIKWGEFNTYLVTIKFYKNQMHTAIIYVNVDPLHDLFNTYDNVVNVIDKNYYYSTDEAEKYLYPYDKSDKDKYTESICTNQKVTLSKLWTFDVNNTPDNKDDDNALQVAVKCPAFLIQVTYQDGVLINQAVSEQETNRAKDY